MALNFVIVIDDGGEMKTVTALEVETNDAALYERLDAELNQILDDRAIAAGEYDPSDNDTPMGARS